MDINVGIDWGYSMPAHYLKFRPRSFQGHPKVKSHANLHNFSPFYCLWHSIEDLKVGH